MRRKKIDQEDVSLDSLLDTMTNVVAILVILLIVTQLGVSDAVKRIAQANPVDPEKVEETKRSITRQQNRLQTLQALSEVSPDSPEEVEFKLKNTTSEIEAAREKIDKLDVEKRNLLLMATAQKEQRAKQEDLDKIQEEVRLKQEAIQRVNAQLEKTPVRKAGPARVVNLPNPRPAPRGAKPFLMLIKEKKVFPLDLEKFRQQAESRARQIVEKARLNRDPEKGIDPAKFLTLFNKQKLRDNYFEVTMKANGPTPVLVFHPQERRGASGKLLTNRAGPFWKNMAAMNPAKSYLSFLVWSESFETYLTMRSVCAQLGLAAGWAPQNTPRPLERVLGGKLRFGPPPPPPKTVPGKPNPAPKTPPKPLPVDTID
ncbi:MAG: hypothetical protein VX768_10895 [Planctomycetota bacterium]|nr:hypothetical protein [Planctomycetota bacterium]